MTIIMQQTGASGWVSFVAYRYLLDAQLTENQFKVSLVRDIAVIDVVHIKEVILVRTVLMFGIKVKYQYKPHVTKVIYIKTLNYEEWGAAFRALKVKVVEPEGWFAFHILDFFGQ